MSRPLRIDYPGAVHHVMARGNAGQPIFLDREDRRRMLRVLAQVTDRYNVRCFDYCLMDNHYHLLLVTLDANLSSAMRQLNGVYGQSFNRRHERIGHLFQGRYRSVLIEKERYLMEVSRYIVLNPVRAGLATTAEEWEWSSYRATIGVAPCPAFLSASALLRFFGTSRREARRRYRAFVEAGCATLQREASPPSPPVHGSRAFEESVKDFIQPTASLAEIPRSQRLLGRPDLPAIFDGCVGRRERNSRIREACLSHGYSQKEIADTLGLHRSTVSRVIAQGVRS